MDYCLTRMLENILVLVSSRYHYTYLSWFINFKLVLSGFLFSAQLTSTCTTGPYLELLEHRVTQQAPRTQSLKSDTSEWDIQVDKAHKNKQEVL